MRNKAVRVGMTIGAIVLLLFAGMPASAQVPLPNLTPYTQDFDTLANSGGPYPWNDDVTLLGWYAAQQNGTLTQYRVSDGSSNTGALYSFGTAGAVDRALGSVSSGTPGTIYYGVRLRNEAGYAFTGFTVRYTGEQWRQGGNTNQQRLAFAYRTGLTLTSPMTGTWTSVNSLDFWSPITGTTATPLDGNLPNNRRTLSQYISTTVDPNYEIMFRWMDINDSGNDHGLGVDDLTITPTTDIILSMSKEVTPTTNVPYHGYVTYTVVLRNRGGVTDPSVYFTDTLPTQVDFDHWVVQPAGAVVSNDVITWNGPEDYTTPTTFVFVAHHVGNYGDVVTNVAQYSGTGGSGSASATFDVALLAGDLTLIYHDLEDVAHVGEDVYVAGTFNSWDPTTLPLQHDAGYTTFTITIPGLSVGETFDYKYIVKSGGDQWDWLNTNNRSHTLVGNDQVDDYRNVVVGWANLQWPPTLQVNLGSPSDPVYGRVYINNVTNPAGEGRGIHTEVGYGNNTGLPNWTWFRMVYNPICPDCGNNDEFTGVMTPTAGGVYSYTTRFTGNWGTDGTDNPNLTWAYGDLDGSPFSFDQAGVMTVTVYDIAIAKSAPSSPLVVRDGAGQLVTYTLQITNLSTVGTPTAITLSDVLPTHFQYSSDDSGLPHSGTGTPADPLAWVFTAPLVPGDAIAFHVVATATDAITASGVYTNQATMIANPPDWVPDNNTAYASVQVYRIVPIAVARAGSDGQIFGIEGRVIYTPGTYNAPEWGIEDASGGIAVYYSPPPAVALGDHAVVVAHRGSYSNQEEMVAPVLYYANLGPGPEVAPITFTTGEVISGTTEGWLIQVEGQVSNFDPADCGQAGNYQFNLDDGTGAAVIFVAASTQITLCATVTDGSYLRVVGFSSQFQTTYEVKPRRPADVLVTPWVVSTDPANGANDVPLGTNVQAVFDVSLDPATVNETTAYLEGPTGLVPAAVSYISATQTVLLDPVADLAYQTTYTASLTTGIESAEGVPMHAPYTWSFTTMAAPEPDLRDSSKLADRAQVQAGGTMTYTIRLLNTGELTATALLTDIVPAEVAILTATLPPGMVYQGGQLLWVGEVAPNQAPTLLPFQVQVNPDVPTGTTVVNVVWIDDGAHLFTRSVSVQVTGAPDIVVTPPTLSAILQPGQSTVHHLYIGNVGGTDLFWLLGEAVPRSWLSEDPIFGQVAPGGQDDVSVTFDATGLAVGTYTTTLEVNSTDPDEPYVYVDVTLVVTTGCVPVSDPQFNWTPVTPTAGQPVTFYGSAQGLEPITYDWSFGDGNAGSGATVLHTYTTAGSYTVLMTATNACSQVTLTQVINVIVICEPPTGADFTWAPNTPAISQTVNFNGSVAGGTPPFTYGWAFGDGGTAAGQNVSYTYAQTGTYTVTLTVGNSCGTTSAAHRLTVVAVPAYTVYLPLIFKSYGP